eukprot:3247143-Pyramimonas_sp.AAC.1
MVRLRAMAWSWLAFADADLPGWESNQCHSERPSRPQQFQNASFGPDRAIIREPRRARRLDQWARHGEAARGRQTSATLPTAALRAGSAEPQRDGRPEARADSVEILRGKDCSH